MQRLVRDLSDSDLKLHFHSVLQEGEVSSGRSSMQSQEHRECRSQKTEEELEEMPEDVRQDMNRKVFSVLNLKPYS